ncbi:MAG: choice-of-anchor J domain-containing protein [Clostridia bacterium]|nr:choice-of-anchor J domain-containing protein [Clostridia bacterium]
MKRRFVSVLLALAMVFSVVLPANIHAISEDELESATSLVLWDFEEGDEGWTFVDADGDGYNWTLYSNEGLTSDLLTARSGYVLLYSESWSHKTGSALTPDNWAISPEFSLEGVGDAALSIWACGQDPSYAEEVFALYAGESSNPDEMTKIGGDFTASGDYVNFTADLSDFLGKEKVYVAIRHYNVTDQFYLNIDDVEIKVIYSCEPGTHVLTEVPEVTVPTCTEDAHCAYYQCSVCGRVFLDAEGLEPVLLKDTITAPALGHDWANCTSNNDGTHTYTCSRCGEAKTEECTFNEKTDSGVSKKVCDVCGYTVYSEVTGEKLVTGWGFEETLEGWTFIDADEDGYCWGWAEYEDTHEGSRLIYSASYDSDYGPLTPDNWAISPAFSLEGQKDAKLSLWASGYSNWPFETFALYASTSPDNLEGFVKISDDITTEDSFKNYTADLSAFDGEPVVYIAIRHYNTENMFYLLLDLVEIYSKDADVCEVHDLTFVPAKDPTETEDGNIDYYYCEECGRYYLDAEGTQPVLPEDVIIPALGMPQFTSHRIVLTGEVGVQFKVTLPESFDASDSSVSFKVSDGRTSTMDIDDATPVDGENAYWFTCYINALELADTIKATFNYGTDGAVTDTYSALTYISAIQAEYDDWSQLCNLVRDLRNYGHYLQLSGWTDGKEHAEIPLYEGSGLSEEDLAYTRNFLAGYEFEVVKDIEGTGVEDAKFALTLNSQQVINFFVKLAEGEEIVNFEGGTLKGTQSIGGQTYYKFSTEEINVLSMFKDYTLTVETTSGTATITANAMTYIDTVVKEGTTFSIEKQYAMVAYYYYVNTAHNVLVNPSL